MKLVTHSNSWFRRRAAAPRSPFLPFAVLVIVGVLAIGLWQRQQAAAAARSVAWKPTFAEALAAAKESDRPVLVSFVMPNCGYCRQMDIEVLPNRDVQEAIRGFVPVRVNIVAQPEIAVRYGIMGAPVHMITDAEGTPLGRVDGFVPADRFTAFLRQAGRDADGPAGRPAGAT